MAAALLLALPAIAQGKRPAGQHGKSEAKVVNVMTRNLYLGADLTPAIEAPGLGAFIEANGRILRDVTANDFPTRAKGLAREILRKKPDL
ncbi:MAG TPA: hypothetical protein VNM89_06730, partial [Solirubrobacterales bacterium]|nr:hypothetical protein [Solirubrobacterales bacterium]